MSLFTAIRQKTDEIGTPLRPVHRILTHPRWVTRGYVFLVEYGGKLYFLVHEKDLEVAIAKLPTKTVRGIDMTRILGIPVSNKEEDMTKIISGVFLWTYKL